MSVTDPIFKPLKHCIYRLVTGDQPITDRHEALQNFCELTEIILRKGAKHGQMFLLDMFVVRDYWHCFDQLQSNPSNNHVRKPAQFDIIMDTVRQSSKVTCAQGRGRYLMRLALNSRILHSVVELLIENRDLMNQSYDKNKSILSHPILSQIFFSLLRQVSELTFQLCLKNHSFLDETWKIPGYREFTLCPSADLGLRLHHIDGRVVVVGVKPGSVSGDSGKVEEGDVLDELYGRALRNITKGTIPNLLKKNAHQPTVLAITKRKLEDGSGFPPIESLIKAIGKNRSAQPFNSVAAATESNTHNESKSDNNDEEQEEKTDFKVTYLGCCSLKRNGGVQYIESAINTVLYQDDHANKPVVLSLGETDVILKDVETGAVTEKHNYTFITACGRCEDKPQHIAYIIGDDTCLLAKLFTAHVYITESLQDSRTILQSIAQGFERTHWFV